MHPAPPLRSHAAAEFRPRQPGVHVLMGDGRHGRRARPVAEAWVALALASGHVVHWIDGACRLDPGRFSPWLAQLGVGPRALRSLRVARGFTAHQCAAMVARLPNEVQSSGSRLVVVDAPMAMFDDDELRARERRDMVRHLCGDLEQTVHANATTVVVIHGRHGPKTHRWRTQRLAHMARSLVEVTAGRDGRLRIRRGQAPWRLLQPLRSRHVSDHRQPTLAEWSPERLQVPTERCEQRPCRAVEATDVNVEGRSEAC